VTLALAGLPDDNGFKAFQELSSLDSYPFLIHCTQGKDRTGLIVALVLFLLDVPLDAIIHDYTLSESELEPERESRLAEIRAIGLSDEFAKAPVEWIPKMHAYLQDTHGGIKAYLNRINVNDQVQSRVLENLQG
jgi:protein-tyrosine phosphatase